MLSLFCQKVGKNDANVDFLFRKLKKGLQQLIDGRITAKAEVVVEAPSALEEVVDDWTRLGRLVNISIFDTTEEGGAQKK
ncbi:MAG: hypothetical protein IID18_08240, partial [Nitrospinae bacterium]|nr:hypothetical protein [Nitrospinota bacterium]